MPDVGEPPFVTGPEYHLGRVWASRWTVFISGDRQGTAGPLWSGSYGMPEYHGPGEPGMNRSLSVPVGTDN